MSVTMTTFYVYVHSKLKLSYNSISQYQKLYWLFCIHV